MWWNAVCFHSFSKIRFLFPKSLHRTRLSSSLKELHLNMSQFPQFLQIIALWKLKCWSCPSFKSSISLEILLFLYFLFVFYSCFLLLCLVLFFPLCPPLLMSSYYYHLVGAFLALIWIFHFWLRSPESSKSSQGLVDEKSSAGLEWPNMTKKYFLSSGLKLFTPQKNHFPPLKNTHLSFDETLRIFTFLPYYFSITHQTVLSVAFVCFHCM